jgi:hypothetical protein
MFTAKIMPIILNVNTLNAIQQTLIMKTVKDLLRQITYTWDHYFLKSTYCQKQINFTDEIKTNYYADIFHYFNATLDVLSAVNYTSEFGESLLQAVGILQMIYAQQDLLDEAMHIFKLPKSEKADKEPNRRIRNELIGHPIRRSPAKNELLSSVFVNRESGNGKIHYVLYAKSNGFRGQDQIYHLPTIIDQHRLHLLKYLTLIWKRVEKIIRQLQKKLVQLEILVEKGIGFEKLVTLTSQVYNTFSKENYLFEPLIIKSCYAKREDHPRYAHAVSLYLQTLKDYLTEAITNIDELFVQTTPVIERNPANVQFTFSPPDQASPISQGGKHFDYEFSKLFEKHPIYGIEFFQRTFRHDAVILNELNHMQANQNDTLEFYASYEYLEILLIENGYLDRD